MAVPALIYLLFTRGDSDAARGWAIPTATDIAFCLAVLAIVGQVLPSALRAFLLTLAVVDDLVAIIIIGLFYASHLEPWLLAGALFPLVAYAVLQRAGATAGWSCCHSRCSPEGGAGRHRVRGAAAVNDVTFGTGSPRDDRVTVAILATALVAAVAGGSWLRSRHRHYERLSVEENRDDDNDGIPDVYQRPIEGQTDPQSDR